MFLSHNRQTMKTLPRFQFLSLCYCIITFSEAFQVSWLAEKRLSALFSSTIEPVQQLDGETFVTSLDPASAFELVSTRAGLCLYESDIRRDAIGKVAGTQASSATNWINDATAFRLKQALERLELKPVNQRTGIDRDEASAWIRWMKAIPAPAILDISGELRSIVNTTLTDDSLEIIDQGRSDFLARFACRLILLPSGASLSSALVEPPASIIYGKLLYGGATRYRLLASSNSNSSPRRVGDRTEVKATPNDRVPAWILYGGPRRMYEAVDMGPAAILEVALVPKGREIQQEHDDMVIRNMAWKPQQMFAINDNEEHSDDSKNNQAHDNINGYTPSSLSGRNRNAAFQSDFQAKVGGLQDQIDAIIRRVLDGRVIRPAEVATNGERSTLGEDETTRELSMAALEAEELSLLGLTPVRGLLLYGPPGCGKTALAREISRALKARSPKIIAAPELLDRWVGGSEKAVRALFADAEAELAACGGDATRSALHVIVIDEIDAVFRKRTAAEDSGEATRSSVVNQILAKLDGVNSIPNVLFIGMTNRRELLDEALLRPGRLEVQIEIPLPDKEGRREILQIHFEALRARGRLSAPLCCAIDGVARRNSQVDPVDNNGPTVEIDSSDRRGKKRAALRQALNKVVDAIPSMSRPTFDLAAEYATGGFSGADIAGLVRCAGSIALARARNDGSGVEGLLITLDDVKQALSEVKR